MINSSAWWVVRAATGKVPNYTHADRFNAGRVAVTSIRETLRQPETEPEMVVQILIASIFGGQIITIFRRDDSQIDSITHFLMDIVVHNKVSAPAV